MAEFSKVSQIYRLPPLDVSEYRVDSTGEIGTVSGAVSTTASLPSSQTPGTSLPASGNASPAKRRYVTDSSDLEVVKRNKESEVELADRSTVLRGTKPNVRRP